MGRLRLQTHRLSDLPRGNAEFRCGHGLSAAKRHESETAAGEAARKAFEEGAMTKYCMLTTVFLGISLLAGCAAGNVGDRNLNFDLGNRGTNSEASSTGNSIALAYSKPRVLLGGTHQFSVSDTNVTWRVNGIPGGNSTLGTISATGLYTAPAVIPISPVIFISVVSNSTHDSSSREIEVGALDTRFAYVSSAADNSIQIFTVDTKTGTLKPTSILSVSTGKGPSALALSPNGSFLYSLNRVSNDISIFAINTASGDLTDVGTASVPDGPYAMVFSASGDFAYVSCEGASEVAAYGVDLKTGALTPLSTDSYAAGGGRIQSLVITNDGKFLYAANKDTNQIVGFAVDDTNGSLTPIPGSPFTARPGLSSIAVNPGDSQGDNMYLYAGSDNGVETYYRNPSSGVLTYFRATPGSAGKSSEFFRNTSDGLLLGVNPQNGGGFSYAFDYLDPPLWGGYPSVSTGTAPTAGGWAWNENDSKNFIFVLNRQADPSSTTGSIGVYHADYGNGLAGPIAVLPTPLHDPTGFVVMP